MTDHKIKFKGIWPVMLTPFGHDKSVDFAVLDRLTEFYIGNGAAGLFANCLSSEMYELEDKERLAIIKSVVERVDSRIPVAATGTFGGNIERQQLFIEKAADLGVSSVVLVTGRVAGQDEDDAYLKERLLKIAEDVKPIMLGLYECPLPFKKIIPPGLVNILAHTGRFNYLKDTTCDITRIIEKINAAANTSLSIFNANTPTALDSLNAGADGLSPISANFYPELYTWLYRNYNDPDKKSRIDRLNDQLVLMDAVTRINYPMSAKVFLAKRGFKINPVIRTTGRKLNYEEEIILEKLFQNYKKVLDELK